MTRKDRSRHAGHAAPPPGGALEPLVPVEAGPPAELEAGASQAFEGDEVVEARGAVSAAAPTGADLETLRRAEREAAEWKDRCLRAAADLENVKKRAARERAEIWGHAQADLLARTLDALDDLDRIAALDPGQTTAQAVHEGVGLVNRKLRKTLEGIGLERVDPAGQPFDPQLHEAVTTMPAPTAAADHTVGAVFQPGYRLNGALVRPARVAVLQWVEPAAPPAGAAE